MSATAIVCCLILRDGVAAWGSIQLPKSVKVTVHYTESISKFEEIGKVGLIEAANKVNEGMILSEVLKAIIQGVVGLLRNFARA